MFHVLTKLATEIHVNVTETSLSLCYGSAHFCSCIWMMFCVLSNRERGGWNHRWWQAQLGLLAINSLFSRAASEDQHRIVLSPAVVPGSQWLWFGCVPWMLYSCEFLFPVPGQPHSLEESLTPGFRRPCSRANPSLSKLDFVLDLKIKMFSSCTGVVSVFPFFTQ